MFVYNFCSLNAIMIPITSTELNVFKCFYYASNFPAKLAVPKQCKFVIANATVKFSSTAFSLTKVNTESFH